jgi:hypothetical protein
MGKPLVLVRGERYFIARCPETKEILDAIQAPTEGAGAPASGEWIVSCPVCGIHTFDLSQLSPEMFE